MPFELKQLRIKFGFGKNKRWLPIQRRYEKFTDKVDNMLFCCAFAGCDTLSALDSEGIISSDHHSNFDRVFVRNAKWKVSKYWVFSGLYFPVFRLNTEIYSVNLRIQSKCRKIRTRKNSVFGHFSRCENSHNHWFSSQKILVIRLTSNIYWSCRLVQIY